MASPTVSDFVTTDITTAASGNHTINIPTSAVAGDRVLVAVGYPVTGQTITPPGSGVLASNQVENTTGGTNGLYVLVYEVQGSETTITVGFSVSTKSASCACRIQGDSDSTTAEISADATGANGPPDPPTLTPTGGSKDYLFIAAGSMGGETAMTAAPTNYSNFTEADTGTAGAVTANSRTGIGTRALTTGSAEDPGAFTGGDATQEWAALTIVFHPAGAVTEHERAAAIDAAVAVASAGTFFSIFSRAVAIDAAVAIDSAATFFSVFSRAAAIDAAVALASAPQRVLIRQVALDAAVLLSSAPQRELLRSAAVNATVDIASSGAILAVWSRSASFDAAVGIATSGTFFSVFERAAALAVAVDLASSANFFSIFERAVAFGANIDIATSAVFFSILERAVGITATVDIASSGEIAGPFTVWERSVSITAIVELVVSGAVEAAEAEELLFRSWMILFERPTGRLTTTGNSLARHPRRRQASGRAERVAKWAARNLGE